MDERNVNSPVDWLSQMIKETFHCHVSGVTIYETLSGRLGAFTPNPRQHLAPPNKKDGIS